MKPLIVFLAVFIISSLSNFPQSRTNENDKEPVNNTEKKVDDSQQVQHPVVPKIDIDIKDSPRNPPTRGPINVDKNPETPTSRPIVPPSGYITPPVQQQIDYVPLPYYDDPPVEEPYYTDPIEPTTPIVIDHDYKELGLSQYKQGKYYEALTSFQIALTKDTLDYLLYYYIGTTEVELERYDDAVYDLTVFINNVIENRLGFYQRGLANFYLGNKDAAFDDLIIADQYQVDEAKVILKRFYDYY
jgi:tetratricopeptide (TPR) repeat protein